MFNKERMEVLLLVSNNFNFAYYVNNFIIYIFLTGHFVETIFRGKLIYFYSLIKQQQKPYVIKKTLLKHKFNS